MVVGFTSSSVLEMMREAFRFLTEDHGLQPGLEWADGIGAGITYASVHTHLAVGWDLRENLLSAEFSPIDSTTHLPRLATRILVEELMAIEDVPARDCVRAPDLPNPETAKGALAGLATEVRFYGAPLLAGQWVDVTARIAQWNASGAWREWRAG